jgi:hypothetical protein
VKRYMPFVLVALLAVFAATAGATNLLQNGSFQSNDFTGWTIGTTQNGTWGQGYPVVTGWPLGGENAAKGEVGGGSPGDFEGGTLTQTFTSGAGAATLSFDYAAMGDGIHTNADGGDFVLVLDGTTLANFDVGSITANQIISGTLSANVNLSAGTHTFEIEVLRQFLSSPGNTPYQYVTNADANGNGVPEPGSLVLMGSGVLGLAGVLRRKISF